MTTVLAYAKLNLALRVRGRRSDGYHTIDSIVQTIDLADRIEFIPGASGIEVVSPFPPKEDLAYRAARTLIAAKKVTAGVRIVLKKMIPTGAGLGGGSSDAAVVLDMVNRLIPPPLPPDVIARIAADLGGDVPLFLRGGRLRMTGKGELITPLPPGAAAAFLVVIPPVHCDTAAVYREYDRLHPAGGSFPLHLGENDLEEAAVSLYPELERYLKAVGVVGDEYHGMSGSGAAVYAAFPSRAYAVAAREKLAQKIPEAQVIVCQPTTVGHEEES